MTDLHEPQGLRSLSEHMDGSDRFEREATPNYKLAGGHGPARQQTGKRVGFDGETECNEHAKSMHILQSGLSPL